MSEPPPRAKRPDYGQDAPRVVRNLAIGGAAALVLFAVAFPLGWGPLARMAAGAAIGCLFGAGWMVWGSKVEKVAGTPRCFGRAAWKTCAARRSQSPPCSSPPSRSASPTRPP